MSGSLSIPRAVNEACDYLAKDRCIPTDTLAEALFHGWTIYDIRSHYREQTTPHVKG